MTGDGDGKVIEGRKQYNYLGYVLQRNGVHVRKRIRRATVMGMI